METINITVTYPNKKTLDNYYKEYCWIEQYVFMYYPDMYNIQYMTEADSEYIIPDREYDIQTLYKIMSEKPKPMWNKEKTNKMINILLWNL